MRRKRTIKKKGEEELKGNNKVILEPRTCKYCGVKTKYRILID